MSRGAKEGMMTGVRFTDTELNSRFKLKIITIEHKGVNHGLINISLMTGNT